MVGYFTYYKVINNDQKVVHESSFITLSNKNLITVFEEIKESIVKHIESIDVYGQIIIKQFNRL